MTTKPTANDLLEEIRQAMTDVMNNGGGSTSRIPADANRVEAARILCGVFNL